MNVTGQWPTAKAKNQWAILEALLRGEMLTVGEALQKYNVYALSQECGRIKKLGWPVKSEMIKTSAGKTIARYSI